MLAFVNPNGIRKIYPFLVERAQMTFTSPEWYVETDLIENPHMNYEYAIKHETDKLEIRYAIRPIDEMLADYEEREKNKKEGEVNNHPDSLYPAIAMAVGFNITGSMPELAPFPPEAVKAEFNADQGVMTRVVPREGFDGGYEQCFMIVIQKNGLGTAYVFYMFDDPEMLLKYAMPAFQALKFKE